MKYISGAIVLVNLGLEPFGHEQAGLRPAILLSVTNNIAVVIPLTSNTTSLRFAATAALAPSKNNLLDTTSVALVFHIRAVDVRRIVKRVGVLDTKDVRVVNALLRNIAIIR